MKYGPRITGAILAIFCTALLFGCADNSTPADTFDRRAMLDDLSSKLIVPAYARLDTTSLTLQDAVEHFTVNPTSATLQTVKDAWLACAEAWSGAVSFDFGPAETLYGNLSVNVGTFPADSAGIEGFVIAGDTLLQNYERDTRGLYGIEYLVFGASHEAVVLAFKGNGGANRSAYLRSITRKMYTEIHDVYSAWISGYSQDFVSRNGTDAGSGTSELFNAMNMSFELIKNYKLGLPLGLRAGQSTAEPRKVEALYSGRSVDLIELHFLSILNIWEGRSLGGQKILGFRDYLLSVPNGNRLVTETELQRDAVLAALSAVPHTIPLSEQIISNPQPATALQTEMQKLTRFFKSELSSLTGLAITYASGDGD